MARGGLSGRLGEGVIALERGFISKERRIEAREKRTKLSETAIEMSVSATCQRRGRRPAGAHLCARA